MPFTPETGVGLAGANAYVTLAEFKAHHDDRGNNAYQTFTDADVQTAIVRATDYIDKRFGKRFRGFRQNKVQGLEWPRINAFDNDEFLYSDVDVIPRKLKMATSEYALRALNLKPLIPDPALPYTTRDATGEGTTQSSGAALGEVIATRKKVGPIEIETKNQALQSSSSNKGSSALVSGQTLPSFPEADYWIEELLDTGNRRLVRA